MATLAENESCCPEWANQLTSVGPHYFGGVVDDAEGLLELHSRSTMCTFGTRTSVGTKYNKADENQFQSVNSETKVSGIVTVLHKHHIYNKMISLHLF